MTTETKPTQASVRADIETAQRGFHELVDSLSDADWKKTTPNESWRVDQLMWHTAWGNGFIPNGVRDARKGSGRYPPQWLFGFLNPWITRFGARGATKESVKAKYDEGIVKVLACLDTVKDDEWDKSLTFVGRTETIHALLTTPVRHLEEHKADVLKGIGRA